MTPGLRRASARALALLGSELLLFALLSLALSGSSGTPWDWLFVAATSVAWAPLLFLDELMPRKGTRGELALSCGLALWAGLALLFAFAQTTYLAQAWAGLDVPRAIDRSGERVGRFLSMAAETRVLLAAVAPPSRWPSC